MHIASRVAELAPDGCLLQLAPGILQGLADIASNGAGSGSDWLSGLTAVAATQLPSLPGGGVPTMDPALLSLLPNLPALMADGPGGGNPLNDVLLQAYLQQQQQQQRKPRPQPPALDPLTGRWQMPLLGGGLPGPAPPAQPSFEQAALSALSSLLGGVQQQQQQRSLPQSAPHVPPTAAGAVSSWPTATGRFSGAGAPGAVPFSSLQQGPAGLAAAPVDALLLQLAKQSGVAPEELAKALEPPPLSNGSALPGSPGLAATPAGLAGQPQAATGDEPMAEAGQQDPVSASWMADSQPPSSSADMAASAPLAAVKHEEVAVPPGAAAHMLPGLSQQLDLQAVQQAVVGSGLNPAVAQEALALLQQIALAATEPALEREKVHNLSIKLFQVGVAPNGRGRMVLW